MELSIQFQSLIVSLVYGILLSYLIKICYRWLFLSKKVFQIPFTLFFGICICLVYFYLLYWVNGGIVHLYFLFLVIVGWFLGNSISNSSRK